MIVQTTPRIRASYADNLVQTGHLHEGKLAKLDQTGRIALATTAADTLGIISEPDPHLSAQLGQTTGATLIPHTFGGIIEIQLGENPGDILPGTLLQLQPGGTAAAATGTSGEHIVAQAIQPVRSRQAGQLIQAVMITPYTQA